jgi:hypothetical protein
MKTEPSWCDLNPYRGAGGSGFTSALLPCEDRDQQQGSILKEIK